MNEFNEQEELERIKDLIAKRKNEVVQTEIEEHSIREVDANSYKPVASENRLVEEIMRNETAIEMAKQKFNDIKNQSKIANKMERVVNKKTKTDLETAELKVDEQRVSNKVERARQRNELLKCKEERKQLIKESRHKRNMQKFRHRKEKYGDILLRHCRKKTKGVDGKWEYQVDKNGDFIINMPNAFILFWLIMFDSIVMFLNQTAEVFAGLNKVVFKAFWVILIITILLVPPFRQFVFGIIGFNIG